MEVLSFGQVLCGNSGPDVDWLVDKFDLDMSGLPKALELGKICSDGI